MEHSPPGPVDTSLDDPSLMPSVGVASAPPVAGLDVAPLWLPLVLPALPVDDVTARSEQPICKQLHARYRRAPRKLRVRFSAPGSPPNRPEALLDRVAKAPHQRHGERRVVERIGRARIYVPYIEPLQRDPKWPIREDLTASDSRNRSIP
jgi:hypothetical protein